MKGHKSPPSSVPAAPFVPSPPSTNLATSMANRPLLGAPTLLTGAETVLHICAQQDFSGHSPEVSSRMWRFTVSTKANEKLFRRSRSRRIDCFASLFQELRIAYIKAGREVNSQEIVSAAGVEFAPVATPAVFGPGGINGSPFSHPPPVRLF
jgi:hypothetical protein